MFFTFRHITYINRILKYRIFKARITSKFKLITTLLEALLPALTKYVFIQSLCKPQNKFVILIKGYQNFATSLCKRSIKILKISRLQFHRAQMKLNRISKVLSHGSSYKEFIWYMQMYLIVKSQVELFIGSNKLAASERLLRHHAREGKKQPQS